MDVVFDIDGTLANAEHRLHLIYQIPKRWDEFLSPELVRKDTAIIPIWSCLESLHRAGNRILFITGRNELTYPDTYNWLKQKGRANAPQFHFDENPAIYMRKKDDRSPSEVSKRKSLHEARKDGYDPMLVFEDRETDTAMWREEGLICCQVAEGRY